MKTGASYNKFTRGIVLTGLLAITVLFATCKAQSGEQQVQNTQYTSQVPVSEPKQPTVPAAQVPVLCYHQIRDWKSTDSKSSRVYIVPVDQFKEQIQMLHDSGYHTIMPDDLITALKENKGLPPHSILITFDDGTEPQYLTALPMLDTAGFKAVFFIMTVTLNRPDYMSTKEVADLADRGHVIGCHTWDHRNVKLYHDDEDWKKEIEKPTATLARITGKPVKYFAYPFGIWDTAIIPKLKQNGFVAAFQLWGKMDTTDPLYTIRRTLVSGTWSNREFLNAIRKVENSN